MPEQTSNPAATLALYADGPAILDSVLKTLTGSDLDLAQTSDSWTIRQIVHHVVDGDDIWKTCIKAALGNAEGLFSLEWYGDKPQWEKSVRIKWPQREERITVGEVLETQASHVVEHVTDIQTVLRAHNR